MRHAIRVARGNPDAPFGTVLVHSQTSEIVAEGINRVQQNPILHGEIDAINHYAQQGANEWSKLRLYTTAEPCCMCQAAIIWAGIPEVIFGVSIKQLMELGWNQIELRAEQVNDSANFSSCKITGGVLLQECDELFR